MIRLHRFSAATFAMALSLGNACTKEDGANPEPSPAPPALPAPAPAPAPEPASPPDAAPAAAVAPIDAGVAAAKPTKPVPKKKKPHDYGTIGHGNKSGMGYGTPRCGRPRPQ